MESIIDTLLPSSKFLRYALVAVVIGIGALVIHQKNHPLAKYPAPNFFVTLPYIGETWFAWLTLKGNPDETLRGLHAKLGKVVRIGPNEVSIDDSDAVKELYGHGNDIEKANHYWAFVAFKWTMFSSMSKVHHAKKRRMLAHSYSLQSLVAMEEYVAMGTRKYLKQMERLANSGESTNIKDWNHWYAFDTIGELALGDNFHLLDGESNTDFVDLVAAHMKLGATFFCCQWLGKYIINPRIPLKWVQDALYRREKLKTVTTELIHRRLAKGSDRKDILARLIEARDPGTGEPLEEAELQTEAWSNIVAGSDTTATSLTSIMFRVMKNSRIYDRLTTEIRTAFPPHSNEIPTYAQTNKLPYLQACIKEALRVLPAIGRPLPRIVPPEGKTLAGETFPAGVIVGIPAWTVHRDKKAWGEDAEVFRPERWLEGDAAKYDRYFIPFSIGPRACIGRNIALMELALLTTALFARYDITLVDPKQNLELDHWMISTPHKPVTVTVSKAKPVV